MLVWLRTVLLRELILRWVDKKSWVLEEEKEVWGSQGGKKDKLFFFLSPELMIAQQNKSA